MGVAERVQRITMMLMEEDQEKCQAVKLEGWGGRECVEQVNGGWLDASCGW